MLGYEDLVPVGGREHPARVEAHPEGRHVGAELPGRGPEFAAGPLGAVVGVRDGAAVAVGVAEVEALGRGVV